MRSIAQQQIESSSEVGSRLVSVDGRELPLRAVALGAEADGGIARVVLRQTFRNPYAEPLSVTYTMPLPADGAVSGYRFKVGDRTVVGEVDRRAAARERFEEAIASGHTAGLVEQERSSVFTQELGNIAARSTVEVELTVDQPLTWLDEGAWEWRFPTVVAPRYLGAEGRVRDAEKVSVDVSEAVLPPTVQLALSIGDAIATAAAAVGSPSHGIASRERAGRVEVYFASEDAAHLDRDVVVRWAVAAPAPGVRLAVGRTAMGSAAGENGYGLVTLVPPALEVASVPRDLIVLIDTSGSMHGEPLAQARRVVSALVDSLDDRDRLELIEFSSAPHRWRRGPVQATLGARRNALKWIGKLSAGGGTEMRSGILEALAPLGPSAQRQVVLVSDGLIGFEDEIIETLAERLPPQSRFHTVGVGSAVNRSLTRAAARAGRGVEAIIGIGEDPERAARRLVARTAAPIIVDLRISGSALLGHAPQRLPDLYAGAPALASVELRPRGGSLVLEGTTAEGSWEETLEVGALSQASGNAAVVALFARERVEDLELALAAGADARETEREIEAIGLKFQISTRHTSWVAISNEPTVDPTEPMRRERVPQSLPYGMSVERLGLRSAAPMQILAAGVASPADAAFLGAPAGFAPPAPQAPKRKGGGVLRALGGLIDKAKKVEPEEASAQVSADAEEASAADFQAEGRRRSRVRSRPLGPVTLRGRIRKRGAQELIVEVDLAAELEWSVPATVELVLSDGSVVAASPDPARTTASGAYGAGTVVRLSLRLVETLSGEATIGEVRLASAGLPWVVRL